MTLQQQTASISLENLGYWLVVERILLFHLCVLTFRAMIFMDLILMSCYKELMPAKFLTGQRLVA